MACQIVGTGYAVNRRVLSRRDRRARVLAIIIITLLAGAVGCGSGSSGVSLVVTAPEKGQVLTLEDDTDTTRAGLQFEITGRARGVADGTEVVALIDDDVLPETAVIDKGTIAIPDVT